MKLTLARFFAQPLFTPLFTLLTSAALGLSSMSGAAVAQKALVEGKDYQMVFPAQPTDAPNKVEVIEFFWYGCPHCNALEPALNDWIKRQGPDVVVRHIPAAFNSEYKLHQRLYYTLDVLGKETELRSKVFTSIHVEGNRLNTPDTMADWAAKNGIDRKKFLDTYNSFSVQAKTQRAAQMADTYAIRGVPAIIVNGKYTIEVTAATVDNLDYLITKERALLKPVAAEPAAPAVATPAATPSKKTDAHKDAKKDVKKS